MMIPLNSLKNNKKRQRSCENYFVFTIGSITLLSLYCSIFIFGPTISTRETEKNVSFSYNFRGNNGKRENDSHNYTIININTTNPNPKNYDQVIKNQSSDRFTIQDSFDAKNEKVKRDNVEVLKIDLYNNRNKKDYVNAQDLEKERRFKELATELRKARFSNHVTNADFKQKNNRSGNGIPQTKVENTNNNDDSICRFYMAPSSIPNSGWGIFTAIDIKKDDIPFYPERVIPILDVVRHNKDKEDFEWMPDNYVWQSEVPGVDFEGYQVDAFIPGPGALPNSYASLNNIDISEHGSYDDEGLHRSKDPGSGAFSYHVYDKAYALSNIASGTELFVSYGEQWFRSRSDVFGMVPLSRDYKVVDFAVVKYTRFSDKNPGILSKAALTDLWTLTQQITSDDPRTINAFNLAKDINDLKMVKSMGSARYSLPNSLSNITWLEQNGLCTDNLRPDKSSIPQAGKGAFATRHLKKGDLVAPTPIMHILDYNEMKMYKKKQKKGNQIFLNYCFSHSSSSILLCPYGHVVNFINHDSQSPNVQVRWSNFTGTHNEWRDRSIEELNNETKSALMFEFIAIRDISAGEEVLLDYGANWEQAWKKHVDNFNSFSHSSQFLSAFHINTREFYRTMDEQEIDPYPVNVVTLCYNAYHYFAKMEPMRNDNILRRSFEEDDMDGLLRPCQIVSRYYERGKQFYTVNIQNARNIPKSKQIPEGQIHQVTRVPRNAIILRDHFYTSDIHLKEAFRHPIGIPDEIFPPAWMNLNETNW